jgi:hypothetical protein
MTAPRRVLPNGTYLITESRTRPRVFLCKWAPPRPTTRHDRPTSRPATKVYSRSGSLHLRTLGRGIPDRVGMLQGRRAAGDRVAARELSHVLAARVSQRCGVGTVGGNRAKLSERGMRCTCAGSSRSQQARAGCKLGRNHASVAGSRAVPDCRPIGGCCNQCLAHMNSK